MTSALNRPGWRVLAGMRLQGARKRHEMAQNGKHNGELTPKQHKALAALLTEPTVAAAAQKVGVGERTVHTWLSEPAFEAAYRAARRDAVGQAIARLQQVSSAAVAVLVRVMASEKTPPSTRVAAAKIVLDTAIRAVELDDLEARIAALEAQARGTP